MNKNIIIHDDCLNVFKTLKDKSIDLILTDPPYGIYDDKEKTGFAKNRCDFNNVMWDEKIPKEYFDEIKRVSKNYIIWGGNYYAEEIGYCKEPIVWDKKTGDNYFADGELAFTSFQGTLRIFRHQWCGCFKDSERGIKAEHPTQKPIKLFEWCLLKYSKENDIILDCFSGSGTTGIACINTNRNYILIEKNIKYISLIEKRLNNAKKIINEKNNKINIESIL